MEKRESQKKFKRVNINLPIDLIEKVTLYGDELGINTTSAYIVLINQALTQIEATYNMKVLSQIQNEIQSLTSEQRKEIATNEKINEIISKAE